eukprot:7540579-Heterocapsa_arctica.AAC.1
MVPPAIANRDQCLRFWMDLTAMPVMSDPHLCGRLKQAGADRKPAAPTNWHLHNPARGSRDVAESLALDRDPF